MKTGQSTILQPLNPADSFTLAMDEEIRKEGMPGSLCGFSLELDHLPDLKELNKRIDEFTNRFPVTLASLQQRGKRFYWCRRKIPPRVFYQHDCPEDDSDDTFHRLIIEQLLNHHEPRNTVAPIEFHMITGHHQHIFLVRWVHPFCDARGADLILKYLCTDDAETRKRFNTPETPPLVNVLLKKFSFWKKIGLFLQAKKHIEQIDELQSIVPGQSDLAPRRLHYLVRRLTEQQTAKIAIQSRHYTGLTGTSLYYIGCMMRALEKITPESKGEAYCVPYAFNLRKQKALSPMTGNHVCALFAQAPRNLVKDKAKLFKHLKQQNANVIRQQLDYAFLPLLWAGSWLSLEKYGKALRQSYRTGTERSSFWFSDIGQPDLSGQTLLGTPIKKIFHLCQVTSPPGLTLLSCIFQNKLTLSYNYIEPIFDEHWIMELHQLLVAELTDESV